MGEKGKEKAIVLGISLLLILSGFLPVVSSIETATEEISTSNGNQTTHDMTLFDIIKIGYKVLFDVSLQPFLTDSTEVHDEKISLEIDYELNDNGPSQPLSPSDPWWNTSWMYRKELKINHTKVAAFLTNFPVTISLASDANLASNAQNDGDDIVFINNATGMKLNHEIELFDGGSGQLVAWVNVTSLSSTVDTIIYMYYGNLLCETMENSTGVWDRDYRMVQHLEETSGMCYDSTVYGNNGTSSGGVNQDIQGMIDGADDFDGNDDSINCSNDGSLAITEKISLEVWIKPDVLFSDWRRILIHGTSTAAGYQLCTHNKKLAFSRCASTNETQSTQREITPAVLVVGNWTYIAAIYDSGTFTIYVNGVGKPSIAGTLLDYGAGSNLLIGRHPDGYGFNGTIDEIRVSSTARDPSWISTCYNNQGDPMTFYSIGSEENSDADYIPPELSNVVRVTSLPLDTNPSFGWINISCEVTDNTAVDQVTLNISNPDSSWNNVTMILDTAGTYYCNSTTAFSAHGPYQYGIQARDTSGNTNETLFYSFSMPPNWDVNMDGVCNLFDVTLLSTKWLQSGAFGWIREDINNDGTVNIVDVSTLSASWLQTW